METLAASSAQARVERQKRAFEEEVHITVDENVPKPPPVGIGTIKAILRDVKTMRDWLLESLDIWHDDSEQAQEQFKSLASKLLKKNPALAPILEDLELEHPSGLTSARLGQKLRQIEEEQDLIQEDLEKLGPVPKKRGRPLGARAKDKTKDAQEEEGPSKRKRTVSKTKKGSKDMDADEDKADKDDKAPDTNPPGDPFADLEEKGKGNRSPSVPLYTKCLVVEYAKKCIEEGNCASVEQEVMRKFKKYFYSYDTETWKSGLLCKWTKFLDFTELTSKKESFSLFIVSSIWFFLLNPRISKGAIRQFLHLLFDWAFVELTSKRIFWFNLFVVFSICFSNHILRVNYISFIFYLIGPIETSIRTYDAEQHHRIPWGIMSVKDKAEMKQLPDWLRRAMNIPIRCRKGHSSRVPDEVEATLNDCLERMLSGFTRDLQSVANLKIPALVETAQHIYTKWKEAYLKACEEPLSQIITLYC